MTDITYQIADGEVMVFSDRWLRRSSLGEQVEGTGGHHEPRTVFQQDHPSWREPGHMGYVTLLDNGRFYEQYSLSEGERIKVEIEDRPVEFHHLPVSRGVERG